MLPLLNTPLSPSAQDSLRSYQSEIDALEDYAQQVSLAKANFKKYNRPSNPTFANVRSVLKSMCSGAKRCMYCEDSRAVDIDHFRPKEFYPDQVFVWENYFYACAGCNRTKSSRFAVYSQSTGQSRTLTRSVRMPPEPGDPLLINPRLENPLDFLRLDIHDTFSFQARRNLAERATERANYTIDILKLNEDDLLDARNEAYENYCGRLHRYILMRDRGEAEKRRNQRVKAFMGMAHPTVWHEMKRQQHLVPELETLFAGAPEALDW